MTTSRQFALIIMFIAILAIGLFFGNIILITISLVPFVVVVLGNLSSEPAGITASTAGVSPKLSLGRIFTMVRTVDVREGCGIIRLYQEIPEEFERIEGENYRVVWKPDKPLRVVMTLRLRCSKRGDYIIPPLKWVSHHYLYLKADNGTAGESIPVSVWPKLLKHREVRQLRNLALSPFPLADTSKIGVAGTDFREIRPYVSGDPVKSINWKATAYRANPGNIWPLVNEYEREGRKSVLMFLDASESVEIGSKNRNVFEYSVEAAVNLLSYFIDRGYRVGAAINGKQNLNFYPDSGRQQLTRIVPRMVNLKATGEPERLLNSIDYFRNYIVNHHPLSVIVTTLEGKDEEIPDRFFDKLKSLYSVRRKPPIVLVNVIGRDLIPCPVEYNSRLPLLMNLQSMPKLHKLRRFGVTIIEWNPENQSFHSVMAGRVRR
ncbi:MAG: DUF58 domain-containing protein [Dehalococcoidales bacterium]|nr:DUF58 domain-containing protein [Dehalococcoidales bacterium]